MTAVSVMAKTAQCIVIAYRIKNLMMIFKQDQEYALGGLSNNIKAKSTAQRWMHEEDSE